MSLRVNGSNVSVVHVRYDGRSYDVRAEDIGNDDMTQATLATAVENNLDLPLGSLGDYEVDIVESTNTLVLRPQAKFGS